MGTPLGRRFVLLLRGTTLFIHRHYHKHYLSCWQARSRLTQGTLHTRCTLTVSGSRCLLSCWQARPSLLVAGTGMVTYLMKEVDSDSTCWQARPLYLYFCSYSYSYSCSCHLSQRSCHRHSTCLVAVIGSVSRPNDAHVGFDLLHRVTSICAMCGLLSGVSR